MRILAIDPGSSESGWCVVRDNPIKIIAFGINENRMMESMIDLADEIDCIAIEWIQGMGMAVAASIFDTCFWAGVFAKSAKCEVRLIPRGQIKMHHCGSMKAKDANIIQALKDKYGGKGTKADQGFFYGISSHTWQAFAAASYVLEGAKSNKEIIRYSRK